MAAEDSLIGFISPQALKDFDEADARLKQTTGLVIELSKAAKDINFKLKSSTSLSDVTKASKAAEQANKSLLQSQLLVEKASVERSKALLNEAKAQKEAELAKKASTQASKEHSSAVINEAKAMTEVSKQYLNEARSAKEAATANLQESKAVTEVSKQKNLQLRYEQALRREKERLEKQMAREQAQLDKNNTAYGQLRKRYTEAANESKELASQYVLEMENLQQLQASQADPKSIELQAKYVAELKTQMEAATPEAQRLYKQLLNIEMAVGQGQRQVGQYQYAVYSLSQVLREAPAFVYSFQTGLLALSNNIPILIDEFNRVKAATGSTYQAFKILGGALFQFSNIATLAVTAGIFLLQYFKSQHKEVEKTVSSLDQYNNALKDIAKNINQNAAKEIAHVQELITVAQDLNIPMKVRLNAVKELQDKYPDYLKNLSQEAILNGNITENVKELNDALLAKAELEASQDRLAANAKRILDLKDQKKLLQDQFDIVKQQKYNIENGLRPHATQEEIALIAEKYGTLSDKIAIINRKIAETTKQGEQYIKDIQDYAQQAGSLAVNTPGGKNSGQGTRREITDAESLNKALADLQKERISVDAETQKQIYQNEKNSIDQRLEAYANYINDQIKLNDIEKYSLLKAKDEEIRITENALDKETNPAKRKEYNRLLQVLEAEKLQIVSKYNVKHEQLVTEDEKGVRDVIKSSIQEQIRVIKEGYDEIVTEVKADENKKLAILNSKYEEGLLTHREYERERQQIQAESQKILIAKETEYLVTYLKKLRDSKNATTEEVEAINKLLAGLQQPNENNPDKNIFGLDLSNKKLQGWLAFANKVTEVFQAITSILDEAYQKQIDQHQQTLNNIETEKQARIDAINSSALSDKQKQEEIAKITADSAAAEKQQQAEINRIKAKQARADKLAAIARIIEETAVAIMSVAGQGPAGIALAVAIGALGAAQLARAAAAPVPQYREGTEDHIGGPAIIGEGGEREYVIEPGKPGYWSKNTATMYDLPKHTQVIPEHKFKEPSFSIMHPWLSSMNLQGYDFHRLERVIKENKPQQPIINVHQAPIIVNGTFQDYKNKYILNKR